MIVENVKNVYRYQFIDKGDMYFNNTNYYLRE